MKYLLLAEWSMHCAVENRRRPLESWEKADMMAKTMMMTTITITTITVLSQLFLKVRSINVVQCGAEKQQLKK